MKSRTMQCREHPHYLDSLTVADGQGLPLPDLPTDCAICQVNRVAFLETREVLRWRAGAEEVPLGEDWQAGVWLRLAELDVVPSAREKIVRLPGRPAEPQHPSPSWNHLWWSVAACVLGVTLAALMVSEQDQGPPSASLADAPQQGKARPRPAGASASVAPVSVALHAYTLGREQVSTLRTGARVESGERLSFDYLNDPSSVGEAMRYLTVVAVQQAERQGRKDAQMVTLMRSRRIGPTDSGPMEINSDVQIDAPAGKMTIYGVFSREPVARSAIETAVLSDGSLPGVRFSQLNLKVNRAQ